MAVVATMTALSSPHFLAQVWISGLPASGDLGHWFMLIGALALAAVAPRRLLRAAGAALDRLAGRPAPALVGIAVLAMAIPAAVSLSGRIPTPQYHDEFSYLIAAQTFAAGRLSNPPHEHWPHFESIHILQQPTYMSKYPPGQGLALAAGIVLLGEPIAGAWLSGALACAGVFWMLLAWLPRRWALIGAILCLLHPQVLMWSQSYWGGAVALLGAALLWGALGRLIGAHPPATQPPRQRQTADAARLSRIAAVLTIMAVGAVILANSRPYEGMLVSVPAIVAATVWLVREFRRQAAQAALIVAPAAAVLLAGAAWMGYYNWRITGRALTMPYALHDSMYNRTPHFIFQGLRPAPTYRHAALAEFHGEWEPQQWQRQQSVSGWVAATLRFKLMYLAMGALQPLALAVPLAALPLVLRRQSPMRIPAIALAIFVVGLLPLTWRIWPHYAAPAAPAMLILLCASMSQLGAWTWGGAEVGRRIVLAVGLVFVATSVRALPRMAQVPTPLGALRERVESELLAQPLEDLVLVDYAPAQPLAGKAHAAWVYNAANIDASPIVWAWSMGQAEDLALRRYFASRRAWLLRLSNPPSLEELPPLLADK